MDLPANYNYFEKYYFVEKLCDNTTNCEWRYVDLFLANSTYLSNQIANDCEQNGTSNNSNKHNHTTDLDLDLAIIKWVSHV